MLKVHGSKFRVQSLEFRVLHSKFKFQSGGAWLLFSYLSMGILVAGSSMAQDVDRARKTLEILASPAFHGRGYVKGGDSIAADYLGKEFAGIGLKKLGNSFYQGFTMSVNTFPGKMKVKVGGKKLMPGKDFIVSPANPSLKGCYLIEREDSTGKIPLVSSVPNALLRYDAKKPSVAPGIQVYLQQEPKLTFSVAPKQKEFTTISLLKGVLPEKAKTLKVDIEAKVIPNHHARNVVGYVEGTSKKDSFLLITAHYDHLGHMGKKAYFPGANDNASGVSMLLELAHYYSQPDHRLPYSVLFIAFAAEEAGLVGSKYFAEHPLVPLPQLKFMLNLDLMGSGKEGLTVVNGSVFSKEFFTIDSLNKANNWFPKIVARGKAANSDHYFFSEKGVPAFFIYTLGEITAYHDVNDKPEVVTFSRFKEAFQLITSFFSSIH